MFENPRRGRQARNSTTNVPKILDLKSSSQQIFFRKLALGAPDLFGIQALQANPESPTTIELRLKHGDPYEFFCERGRIKP